MAKREYNRNGAVRWYDDKGHAHRKDGPAVVWSDGEQWWLRHGDFHFARGPSDLYADGRLRWYEDGDFLRVRGLYG